MIQKCRKQASTLSFLRRNEAGLLEPTSLEKLHLIQTLLPKKVRSVEIKNSKKSNSKEALITELQAKTLTRTS